ncbi:MAG: MerC domain-containing protein [Pseudomonadales bacterium]|nr:MerC domain-containing protein [Pseudomonadales bacterium]
MLDLAWQAGNWSLIVSVESAVGKFGLLLDRTAIGLSAICVIHCLALPIALALLPSLALVPVADESFHVFLVWLVLPTSVIALALGCKRHQRWHVVLWGVAGLTTLIFTAALDHDFLGESLEKWATVAGATLVAMGHILNYRHYQSTDCHND